jgi:hypothetical protein
MERIRIDDDGSANGGHGADINAAVLVRTSSEAAGADFT